MKVTPYVILFIASWIGSAKTAPADSPIRGGDRIAIVGNTFADQLRIHGYLETLLLQHTRENPVAIRNLGWGGDMLKARDRPTGFPTEATTLSAHKTDVIIACFGMGESFGGKDKIEDFKDDLRAFIASHAGKKYNGKSDVRLILVSPIACEDLSRLTPMHEGRNRDLEAYTLAMREVADAAKLPFVDLFATSRYLMDESAGPNLTTNGIHLGPYGYWAISQAFFDQLIASRSESDNQPWKLTIDASTKTSESRGVEISNLIIDEAGLSFVVAETSTPRLAPPTDSPLPPQLEFNRDQLTVKGLASGNYELRVDGKRLASADADAWSEGVAIDTSPAHVAADLYREAVNDKNLQFTYSWKALNQVHIVGERRSSPSGRELPKEVVQFRELANELDQTLREGIELTSRQWQLQRISN